jgi:hypothetical protein
VRNFLDVAEKEGEEKSVAPGKRGEWGMVSVFFRGRVF